MAFHASDARRFLNSLHNHEGRCAHFVIEGICRRQINKDSRLASDRLSDSNETMPKIPAIERKTIMRTCKNCGYGPLATDAFACPRCVQEDPSPDPWRYIGIVAGGLLGLAFAGIGGAFFGACFGRYALPVLVCIVALLLSPVWAVTKLLFRLCRRLVLAPDPGDV